MAENRLLPTTPDQSYNKLPAALAYDQKGFRDFSLAARVLVSIANSMGPLGSVSCCNDVANVHPGLSRLRNCGPATTS